MRVKTSVATEDAASFRDRVYRDPSLLDAHIALYAERGAIAPESLSLSEIRIVCEAHVRTLTASRPMTSEGRDGSALSSGCGCDPVSDRK